MKTIITDRVGEKYITNKGYKIEIIEYFGWDNCTIKFEDGTIIESLQYDSIKRGNIKNPNHRAVFGVGFIGHNKYKLSFEKVKIEYHSCWSNMLRRCYDNKYKEKYPTYKDVIVCEDWHNFQVFAKWMRQNYNSEIMLFWQLDKDILVKGNKMYSPKTCYFVPAEINGLFIKKQGGRGSYPIGVHKHKDGKYVARIRKNNKLTHLGLFDTPEEAFQTYKIAKEICIKETADKNKFLITLQTYQAMYNYEVEITD